MEQISNLDDIVPAFDTEYFFVAEGLQKALEWRGGGGGRGEGCVSRPT